MRQMPQTDIENYSAWMDTLLEKGIPPGGLVALLQAIQRAYGFLPEKALRCLAEKTGFAPARITGAATFYSQFRLKPAGEHRIKVCVGTACHVKGAPGVIEAFKRRLDIPETDDTDAAGRFTIEGVPCLGCCMLAPAVQIDQLIYGPVTAQTVGGVIDDFLIEMQQGRAKKTLSSHTGVRGDIRLCLCSSCRAAGADRVAETAVDLISRYTLPVGFKEVACTGISFETPLVEVVLSGDDRRYRYGCVNEKTIEQILFAHFSPARLGPRLKAAATRSLARLYDDSGCDCARMITDDTNGDFTPFTEKQVRIATASAGEASPLDIDNYRQTGGFEALARCTTAWGPEDVLNLLTDSGLKGRGGGGFPTAAKWWAVHRAIEERGAGSGERGAKSGERGAKSEERGASAGAGEQTNSKHEITNEERMDSASERPTSNIQHPTSKEKNEERRTRNEESSFAKNYGQLTTDNEQPANAPEPGYLICNADEGDPGAFMDRMMLESFPFRVVEGMAIAARTLGIREGFVYIRAEYPLAVERMQKAIEICEAEGILRREERGTTNQESQTTDNGQRTTDNGRQPGLHLQIIQGAGAFVCGEETALIAAVEGGRGEPHLRPPYPSLKGLRGKPTLVNNVETFAVIPWIVTHGAPAFAELGTTSSAGTKTFALAGNIRRGGLIEVPMGMTIREIVNDIGGGVPSGRMLKAVQIGGPSGGCVPASLADTPVDYSALKAVGAMMGSGGLVVLDNTDCMVDVARYFMTFVQAESCGKCTCCRVGTWEMLAILERLCAGEGRKGDLEALRHLAATVKTGSLCGLGKTAPNPVVSTLEYFADEYEAHLAGRCPAGKCRALIHYTITERCIGCTRCAQACPSGAIQPVPYRQHAIDDTLCVRCNACRDVCPASAVKVE